MIDLKLLGNIIVDDVYRISQWANPGTSNILQSHQTSIGGLGNIIEVLKTSGLKISIEGNIGNDENGLRISQYLQEHQITNILHSLNKPTSHALILSDLASKERTSFVDWGCAIDAVQTTNNPSNWAHISYLDATDIDLLAIRKSSTTVSADLCKSNMPPEALKKLLERLKYIDYLFVSESEIQLLTQNNSGKELCRLFGLKCLVFHSRQNTQLINAFGIIEVMNPYPTIPNVDVLGAGDAYCAGFIQYLLTNSNDLVKASINAHQVASHFLAFKR